MPVVPPASEDVLIASVGTAAAIVIVRDLLLVCCGEPASATLNVIEKLPDCVGVPEIAPVEALSVKPVGKEPVVIDQL